jgi:hypothetical protein
MPGYVEAALHKFQHPAPTRPEDSPHAWNQPTYGAKIQYAEALDTSPRLSAEETTRIQQVIGTFLYYGIAVVNSASVCAPTSAPRLVRLTPDSASVHPPPSAPRLLRLMKQTICGRSRPTNFKRPITRFVLTS